MTHIAHKDIVTGCSMVSGHFDYSNKILLRDGGFEKNGNRTSQMCSHRSFTGEILTVTMLRQPIKRVISEYHFIMERMKRHPVAVSPPFQGLGLWWQMKVTPPFTCNRLQI